MGVSVSCVSPPQKYKSARSLFEPNVNAATHTLTNTPTHTRTHKHTYTHTHAFPHSILALILRKGVPLMQFCKVKTTTTPQQQQQQQQQQ
jgi:hypothetical protein